jgi:hypothetical protein
VPNVIDTDEVIVSLDVRIRKLE